MTTNTEYIPGMCNIGPAERRMRRMMGIGSGIIAVALLIVLLATNTPAAWRLLIFIPAAGAAMGLLQDSFHFCAAFGLKGIYNIMHSAGITESVELEAYRKQDVRRAVQIVVLSLCIAGLVTALAFLV